MALVHTAVPARCPPSPSRGVAPLLLALVLVSSLPIRTSSCSSSLPTEIGLTYTYTDYLYRSGCSSSIPTQIGMLTDLTGDVMLYDVTGTLPTELGKLTKLTNFLDIYETDITGKVPTELGKLVKLEQYVDLSGNVLGYAGGGAHGESGSGTTLPTELGDLSFLASLSLKENWNVTGQIPTEFGRLTGANSYGRVEAWQSLAYENTGVFGLNVATNYLTGTVPSELGLIGKHLLLQSNLLCGAIPHEVAAMSSACPTPLPTAEPEYWDITDGNHIGSFDGGGCGAEVDACPDADYSAYDDETKTCGGLPSGACGAGHWMDAGLWSSDTCECIKCANANWCPLGHCREHHGGFGCGECNWGFRMLYGFCTECPTWGPWGLMIGGSLMLVAVYVVVEFGDTSEGLREGAQYLSIFSIIVNHFQFTLLTFQLNLAYPKVVVDVVDKILPFCSLAVSQIAAPECAGSKFNPGLFGFAGFAGNWAVTLVMPCLLMLPFALKLALFDRSKPDAATEAGRRRLDALHARRELADITNTKMMPSSLCARAWAALDATRADGSRGNPEQSTRVIGMLYGVSSLFVLTACMQAWDCEESAGKWRLHLEPSIFCSFERQTWPIMLWTSIAVFVLFFFGANYGLYYVLKDIKEAPIDGGSNGSGGSGGKQQKAASMRISLLKRQEDKAGFIYLKFTPKWRLWELALNVRKFLFAAIVVFCDPLGPYQAGVAMFLIASFLVCQMSCRPDGSFQLPPLPRSRQDWVELEKMGAYRYEISNRLEFRLGVCELALMPLVLIGTHAPWGDGAVATLILGAASLGFWAIAVSLFFIPTAGTPASGASSVSSVISH